MSGFVPGKMKRIQLPETREETKARLVETGEWLKFRQAREVYHAKGYRPWESHLLALNLFPPRGWRLPSDSGGGAVELAAQDIPVAEVGAVVKRGRRVMKMPMVPKEAIVGDVESAPSSASAPVVLSGAKRGGTAAQRIVEEMYWIYDNLAVSGLTLADAPSPGAYAYLMDCQGDDSIKFSFRKDIFAKLIPSRSVLEDAEKRRDSGRKTLDLLERLRAHVESERLAVEDAE